jgi:hypothetical protein
MSNMNQHEDMISYILIGVAIGIAIGFLLKVFVDTYNLVESLPI